MQPVECCAETETEILTKRLQSGECAVADPNHCDGGDESQQQAS
jgi:hypothetical protein